MVSELERIIGQGPVHFIGIGGISMSGLARLMLHRGIAVSGSDQSESASCDALRSQGAAIRVPHMAETIGGQSLVVYSAAIGGDNVELAAARQKGIPCMDRGRFLGLLAQGYARSYAISGTHGKTTSTGMLASILLEADADPTIHIGGILPSIGGNTRIGGTGHFVMEACEYKNSYHQFYPTHALILNLEADHLDFFRDLEDIIESFARYTENVAPDGELVLNIGDAGCRSLIGHLERDYVGYLAEAEDGSEPAWLPGLPAPRNIYGATRIEFEQGLGRFDVTLDGERLTRVRLSVPGRHNVQNALGCFALAHRAGFDPAIIADGLESFTGTGRRFETLGKVRGARLIDDYAHHPSAITATLSTARSMTTGRILCVFQPHTYTRTLELFSDFATTLAQADHLLIVDIYAAREPDLGLVHAKDLVEAVNAAGGNAEYAASFQTAADRIRELARPEDLIFTMGAGNVNQIAALLLKSQG